MPEVLVSSVILATTVAMSAQLSNSSMVAMGRSDQRTKVDAAIAERIEALRSQAFAYECLDDAGCHEALLSQALAYGNDLVAFKQACASKTLGADLRASIEENDSSLLSDFSEPQTGVAIHSSVLADGNQLHVVLSAPAVGTTFSGTIVPMAQGWCP